MTQNAKTTLDKVLALRKHTFETGMITRRSQNTLLAKLSDADLPEVVLELEKHRQEFSW